MPFLCTKRTLKLTSEVFCIFLKMAKSAETCCYKYHLQIINFSRQLMVTFNLRVLCDLSQRDKMNKT
jgi:hypothetical protein